MGNDFGMNIQGTVSITGRTRGHVFAVDVLDCDDASAPSGYSRTFTDRQHERAYHDAASANTPAFQVYAWKVKD